MGRTFFPGAERIAERFLSRGHVLRGDLGVEARARRALHRLRPVIPGMTDAAPCGLRLRLHGGRLAKTIVEDERLPPVRRAEGVDLHERLLLVERLHRPLGIFRRYERHRAAAERVPQTRDAQLGESRSRPKHKPGGADDDASLSHEFPVKPWEHSGKVAALSKHASSRLEGHWPGCVARDMRPILTDTSPHYRLSSRLSPRASSRPMR